VPRDGLQTSVKRHSLRELAREVLKISRFGLERRAKLSPQGTDETVFLEPLDRIIETGKTQSDELLAHYRGDWKNSVTPVFKSLAYR
jgi:glutamate--cysteine ligase